MPRKIARPLPTCPRCGRSDAVAPVLYGLLDDDGLAAAERDGVVIGGCEVGLPFDCVRCAVRFDENGATEQGPPPFPLARP